MSRIVYEESNQVAPEQRLTLFVTRLVVSAPMQDGETVTE